MRKISPDLLLSLLFTLLRIRRVEEAIAREYSRQEMRCPIHLCIGEEAVATGVCANLCGEDIVLSLHRSHGHFLAKGGSLRGLIAELYGKATGVAGGYGGSQHLVDLSINFFGATPIVASTIPVAVGTAWATMLRRHCEGSQSRSNPVIPTGSPRPRLNRGLAMTKKPITTVFFGEAAVEEGVVHESFNFAVLKQLPVFFVCENNQYSVNTPMMYRQPSRTIYHLARAHGMPAYSMDGNNVQTVYKKAKEVIADIRAGYGPALIECHTYRHLEHCGPHSDAGIIRPEKEVKEWQKKDPVERMKQYMLRNTLSNNRAIRKMEEKIQKEIHEAFRFAKDSPFPKEKLSEEMVYAK